MKNLNQINILEDFGQSSIFFENIYPLLNSFLKANSNYIASSKIFKNIFNEEEIKNIQILTKKMFIQLLLERIILNALKKKKISKKLNGFIKFLDFFFNLNEFFASELNKEIRGILDNYEDLEHISSLIDNQLKEFSFSIYYEDVFSALYQDIIKVDTRHGKGEYYTPKWLIDKILDNLWPEIKELKEKKQNIKVLDPACGSGTFIIEFLLKALEKNLLTSVKEVFSTIYGFDINKISLLMTKVNIFLILLNKFPIEELIVQNVNQVNFINIDTIIIDLSKNDLTKYINNSFVTNFKNKFDLIIGNPPWITLKSIKNKQYHEKAKNQFFKYQIINKKETHLITQLEIASLFYVKAIDLYLSDNGLITFVMPKSVMLATKHNLQFQKFLYPKSKLLKIWDLQNVKNLFGMPTCVLFGMKSLRTEYPVDLYIFKSKNQLNAKNSESLIIEMEKTNYSPPVFQVSRSFYYNMFKVGASIFPRNLYFIKIIDESINTYKVITDPSIEQISKEQWKSISLSGEIRKNFVFCTLLAWELLPFGFISLRNVVLPIIIDEANNLISVPMSNMDEQSKNWFVSANNYWAQKSTEKSKIRFPSLFDRLNYNNLLIKQELKNFLVLYSGTGTNICSCVIERNKIKQKSLSSRIFVADVKTWIFETDNKQEAHYLSALLNSSHLNELIKPLQPQGLGGGRAIHRRPLEFPIEKYNEQNHMHQELSQLSIQAHELIDSKGVSETIKSRKHAREIVKTILDSIDKLTKTLLSINAD